MRSNGDDDVWDAKAYPEGIREEIPLYERLQDEVTRAASAAPARTILELGVGTGETTRRLLELHPEAAVLGIDSSPAMLAAARLALPHDRVDLQQGRLEDPLPGGPFDLVVSVLAVHHLDGAGKKDLFARIVAALEQAGTFVLGDLVVPERPEDVVTQVDGVFDRPDSVHDQLAWLAGAGLAASVSWSAQDLAVLSARPL